MIIPLNPEEGGWGEDIKRSPFSDESIFPVSSSFIKTITASDPVHYSRTLGISLGVNDDVTCTGDPCVPPFLTHYSILHTELIPWQFEAAMHCLPPPLLFIDGQREAIFWTDFAET